MMGSCTKVITGGEYAENKQLKNRCEMSSGESDMKTYKRSGYKLIKMTSMPMYPEVKNT